jgi:hypothetical protein
MSKMDLLKPDLLMESDLLSEILLIGSAVVLFLPLLAIIVTAIAHLVK